MTSPLLDDPSDLSALRANGADPDELFASFAAWAQRVRHHAVPGAGGGADRVGQRRQRRPGHPDRLGQVAGGHRRAVRGAGGRDRRSYYTAPIKALVSEKFFALCEVFGAANVGMLTGDAAVNAGAPIIACTAEVLANIALREGADADIGLVVMDEFHFYGDPDRGWAWQVPLLELPQAQFLLMSATLGDVTFLREDLTRRTGRPTALIANAERPVPLYYSYATTPMHETIAELLDTKQAPVYVVHFTQAVRAGAGAGADERQRLHQGGEGRDRRADRRVPVLLRHSARRCRGWCATASACTTPGCCPSTGAWSSSSPRPAC